MSKKIMVKANELRIGNCVRHKRGDEDFYRDYVIDGIGVSKNGNVIAILKYENDFYRMAGESDGDLQPICLTPEILERCGFEKWENTNVFQLDCADEENIQIRGNEVFLAGNEACIDGHGFHCKCDYLHQLQNLYFALTGEELEIKQQSATAHNQN
jgi:hypothetical protein